MKAQGRFQSLIECVFACVLILSAAGCGDATSTENPAGSDVSVLAGNLAINRAPPPAELVYADAGDIVAVRVNQFATLDGSASGTTLADPLSYAWSFTSKPDASNAVLQNATSVNPGFLADVAGTYMVQLVVSAGGISSQRAIATVEVSIDGHFTGIRVHMRYPSRCADCHDGRYALGDGPIDPIPGKPGNHPATSNFCQACHTTFGFNLIRFVDHREVFGNCSSCHNGVTAVGKSQFHINTSVECNNCHTTTSFLALGPDGRFDHAGITRACATCHNGTTAIGKHDGHFVTGTDCGSCHTTDSFKNAYVDHSNITDNCASCHNGTDATGQTPGHPVMAVDCGSCHGTTKFSLDGVFNHRVDATVQPCADCHNDNNSIGARGKLSALNHVPTIADCGVCHGVGGGNFANGIFDHAGIVDSCETCHGDSGNGSGLGKTANHFPTGADCSVCHTTGTFVTGVFDHDPGVVDPVTCASCHNDVFTAGKNVNHVPTSGDCRVCHLSTQTFVGTLFNHTGITNNCASCHNGTISPGKSSNHLPTTRDCSDCHVVSQFTNFTGASFDHQGVANNCATCHDGVIAMGKKLNHIPAQRECSQCHLDTNTGGFISSIFLTNVHPGIAGGCEGCHNSQIFPTTPAVVKTANHLPTLQDCHVCHTNLVFSPSRFNHAGISSNCASCHDGSANNVALGAWGKTPTHPDTTADCGTCHGIGLNFTDGIFDHTGRVDNCSECHGDNAPGAVTKKNSGHVVTTQDCSICHVPGTFTTAVFSHLGIVTNCASCHQGAGAIGTVMSGNHLPTTDDCSLCHNTTAFAGARFDHTGTVNNCASCHDGNIARGKGGTHVPTSSDCSVCHQTTGFVPGTFDHVGIVANCQSCHDGAFARGKINGHVLTNQDCGVCHTTRGFLPASFDHSTVSNATRCDSCHGVTATGMDAKTNPVHIPTSLDCRSCHTTATFVGGSWTHDASSIGQCKSCHSAGGGATPQPSQGHIATDVQCDTCHSTSGWAPTSFSHSPQGNYPGDHRLNLGCSACHGSIVTTPFVYPASSAQYAPYCAACHAGDFRRESAHNGGSNGTVEQNKNCGASGCHRVNSSSF